MQTPTHLKTGVWIDRVVPDLRPGSIRRLLVAVLGIYSHAILDSLAALTYHPPDPSPGDRFWVGYHAAVTTLTLRVWKKNQQQHKWAMICSVLPDLDWLFIKTSAMLGNQIAVSRRPTLHGLLSKALYSLPLFRLLNHLPDLRQKKAAAILELILYLLLSGDKDSIWKQK